MAKKTAKKATKKTKAPNPTASATKPAVKRKAKSAASAVRAAKHTPKTGGVDPKGVCALVRGIELTGVLNGLKGDVEAMDDESSMDAGVVDAMGVLTEVKKAFDALDKAFKAKVVEQRKNGAECPDGEDFEVSFTDKDSGSVSWKDEAIEQATLLAAANGVLFKKADYEAEVKDKYTTGKTSTSVSVRRRKE